MDYPLYVEVDNEKYKINTDFRVAIECGRVAEDGTIGDLERGLAIIYLLFGEKGINAQDHYEKLLELAQKYLLCGNELEDSNGKPDMDFIEDYSYIRASFRSDYGIKIDEEKIHWWEFMELMNGLSNSELGNCCILNRIRNLRNYDTKDIKDAKLKSEINKAKQKFELKRNQKPIHHTKEQRENVNELLQKLNLRKE